MLTFATKLYRPPLRRDRVQRPRLIERLQGGLASGRSLTLISAAAGFGKSTLLIEWIAVCGRPVAWLSLDAGDGDPARFLTYLVAAFQTIQASIGTGVLAMLQSPQPPSIESMLTALVNELALIPDPLLLVLDDYHTLDSQPVDTAMALLLERLPPQLHLVITTREDPALPLARLRARNQMTELRSSDLRFTPDEVATFLNEVMGLSLAAADIAALERRTEGWIAGLQLAALSIQGQPDPSRFIASFTGSHRFVLDYLVEEVLRLQSESMRSFLLQSSILDRLCAPLCNVLMDRQDSREVLNILERSNLFLIPLDDQRQWYRYHHLFADVLQTYLREEYADRLSTLHLQASVWFEQHELPADAIQHALAARDFERAANLIERFWLVMDISYQYSTWLGWAKALPRELVRAHPVLSVGFAWALMGIGELEASEAYLQDAERWLEPTEMQTLTACPERNQSMIVVDESEFRSLPASIAAARTYRSLALGDLAGTKAYARQALALSHEPSSLHSMQATALLGFAEYASGDMHTAEQELLKFQALMWQVNDVANAIGITFALANIMVAQGHLREAISAYQQSLQLAARLGMPSFLGASDLHRGLSELLCELNDLQGAAQSLQTAQQLGELSATTGWPQRLCVAQARLKESQGDLNAALILLDAAERQYVRNPLHGHPIAALKARIWVRQGRLSEALAWLHEQQLSPDDDLSYAREFEHLTLAHVLIARYNNNRSDSDLQAALSLLERLLHAAEADGRHGNVIEILILQALAHQAHAKQALAHSALERALTLAEPEGYLRIFVDEGDAMRRLLEKQAHNRDNPLQGYVDKLLAAFPQAASPQHQKAPPTMVEPLSERELDVLMLLRSELSGPEIAKQLIVSINTLRSHTKSIFIKLGVNNRRAAVRRAEELDLF